MKPDAKLIFVDNGETWSMIVQDLSGNILNKVNNMLLLTEQRNAAYFDGWENQIRMMPIWNIVEVVRFV